MGTILLIVSLAIIVVILLAAIAAIIFLLFYAVSMNSNPPFIPTPYAVLPMIYKALDIKDGHTVFDLGSGDCRVIMQCYLKNPKARYIAVEKNLFPHTIARMRLRKFLKDGQFDLVRENFFNTDLSTADRIFIYLLPQIAAKITDKFESELKPNTRVVSLDFQLNKKPSKVIDLERPFNILGQKLYIYDF